MEMKNYLIPFDRVLGKVLKKITLWNFVALLFLLSAVVFVRFVPLTSLGWSDEIVEWSFAWMIFVGTAALWRDNEHFSVQWLPNKLKGKTTGRMLGIFVEILSIFFLAVMTYYGSILMISAHDRSPILELPRHIWYLCIPLAGLIMIGYSLRNLLRHWKQ
ncbi:MAG: TRAP transporter small permease [Deltaproteobacteria bacterium]|jgi:TRAP-type C4-dicarboxylate transport system permease small subunit|nr:TRAP transporter small permease [Deltaproteobacteria bacterium]